MKYSWSHQHRHSSHMKHGMKEQAVDDYEQYEPIKKMKKNGKIKRCIFRVVKIRGEISRKVKNDKHSSGLRGEKRWGLGFQVHNSREQPSHSVLCKWWFLEM